MTPAEYTDLALRTEHTPPFVANDPRLSKLFHAAMGMATESGEVFDILKRHVCYGKDLDEAHLLEEVGDLLWYIALALSTLGTNFEACMEKNVAKLEARYGGKFSPEKALNRDLEGERAALAGSAERL